MSHKWQFFDWFFCQLHVWDRTPFQSWSCIFRYLEADNDDEAVCTDLDETYDYLINLWVVGHARWVQAYKIRSKNQREIKSFADEKKKEAQSKIQTFMDSKEDVKPTFCHCFETGILYLNTNPWLTSSNTMSSFVRSAGGCQTECKSQENCKFWSFIHNRTECQMFDENAIQTPIVGKDIISGPKICPSPTTYFTFCCGLGYGASVTITILIVLISLIVLWQLRGIQFHTGTEPPEWWCLRTWGLVLTMFSVLKK